MHRKRILFVTDSLAPEQTANSEIVYRLANVLGDTCDVYILGYNRTNDTKEYPNNNGKYTELSLPTPSHVSYAKAKIVKRIPRWWYYITHHRCFFYSLNMIFGNNKAMINEYKMGVEESIKEYHIDSIVGFSFPSTVLQALGEVQTSLPIILYKLDPWSTHYGITNQQDIQVEESVVDSKAAAIVVTEPIYKDYCTKLHCTYLDKLHVFDFPNIISSAVLEAPEHQPATEPIRCVFLGNIYRTIREPSYTFSLFKELAECGIELQFYGMGYYPPEKIENVHCFERITTEEALLQIQKADILVNIGNTVTNQMPSKILTYISTGKPILNIIKTPECPTLPYMERYPLALNILETETVEPEIVEKVRDFCLQNKGKQIPFEEIEKEYYTCTPEYVGQQLYDIICKVIEERKKEK